MLPGEGRASGDTQAEFHRQYRTTVDRLTGLSLLCRGGKAGA